MSRLSHWSATQRLWPQFQNSSRLNQSMWFKRWSKVQYMWTKQNQKCLPHTSPQRLTPRTSSQLIVRKFHYAQNEN
ncbi:hypothetical protein D7Y42_02165 [Stenotrophomonas maltophilia]|nr:hypothetical protein [Stenotrophomonas maltophilia]